MEYRIYHHGDRAVCPLCAGMLKPKENLTFTCTNCGSFFYPIDEGQNDRELTYEAIKGSKV